MNTDLPRFTNLGAIAMEIRDKPDYRKIGRTIDRVIRSQSCVADLMEASTCIEVLTGIRGSPEGAGSTERLAVEASLMRTAVTLYERATAAGAKRKERGSIQIRDRLSAAEHEDHDALVSLRHRTFAHVYTGEEVDEEVWHSELVFAMEVGPTWAPGCGTKRVQFAPKTFARLVRQLPVAREKVRERYLENIGTLAEILMEHPLPMEMFERHSFDPIELFGGYAQAKAIVDGRSKGFSTVTA